MDKYTKAVRRLQNSRTFKRDVLKAWNTYRSNENGCLFKFCTPPDSRSEANMGCLTMVKNPNTGCIAYTPELTAAIQADKLLPDSPLKVTKKNILRFAYWQRKMDKLWKQLGF